MKKIFILFSFITIGVLFYSCSTDFNITAPYKETMVIYGLLNPDTATKVQYIRISKAYLGEGNSLIMAEQKDSINYANVLDVKLQRIDLNGNIVQTINLQRVDTNVKDPGIFNNPYAVLYKIVNNINANINPIRTDGSKYMLTAHNNQTGITATSITDIVGDFEINNPSPPTPPNYSFNFTLPQLRTFSFSSGENALVYNLTIRFHYKEVNVLSNDTISKYVDWNLGDQAINGSLISYTGVYLPDLYRIVGSAVAPADTNLLRRFFESSPRPIEFIFTAGTEDLYTYQQIVQPSLGVVQDRPLFTNIENGIGLFTSRYMKSLFYNLNGTSIAAFDTSAYTHDIHFH